jgi:CheY-like chemotaxis protein
MSKITKEKFILLVEDNPSDEVLALRALQEGKIDVHTMVVRDGQEALDYLFCEGEFQGRSTGNPQIVLLDLKLPKVDGLEVLKRIRSTKSTHFIPVVILTSSREEQDKILAHKNGVTRYLTKPIDMEKFSEAMQHFLFHYAEISRDTE